MDDVQYALQKGSAVEQSFLFVIDSSMRDVSSYPTPSDYYIPFPQPFRNVFAVDIVDATIPRTEYSIDIHNNTFVYAPGLQTSYDSAQLSGSLVTVTLRPGDYNTVQLVNAMNDLLGTAASAKDHVPLQFETVTDPADITNCIRLIRSEPFTLFMKQSTMRGAIGFGNPASTPGATVGWDSKVLYATDAKIANEIFQSVAITDIAPTLTYAGPVPVELVEYTLATPVRQTFTATTSGLLDSVIIKGKATSSQVVTVTVSEGGTVLDTSTVTATTASGQWTASFDAVEILAGNVYVVSISGNVKVYKAEMFSDDLANQIEVYTNGQWTVNSTFEGLCCDLSVAVSGYKIEAPGQCNLTGERYVLIKSPDVEQYMHRDLAASFDHMAPGLGLVKLGGLGLREERFNFLAYATRKFHPIGKFKGMRIRLETSSGRLYNAHGCNHTLLVCVKMYGPGQMTVIPRDLYPGYTPDPQQAFLKKLERERC